MPDERRASDIKLEVIERKLDEHSQVLNGMKETLSQIALQNYQIQSMQGQINELRGDVNEVYRRQETIINFQSTCPRSNFSLVWKTGLSIMMIVITAFVGHIFVSGGK